jgi:Leucine-rich repeat (LRR) protein
MFYKSLLFLSLLFYTEFVSAQVDSIGVPTIGEKASIKSAVYVLEDFLNAYSTNKPEEECKQASLKLLKEGLSKPQVTFPNYLDSDNAKISLLEYAKHLQKASSGKWSTVISIVKWNQLANDKLRNKHFTIVNANVITTIESIDASGDTLEEEKIQPLLLYFRFDKIQSISTNFRLFDIILPGQKFTLEPLPENVEWWLSLEKPWQDFFRKHHKMHEFPSEVALIHLLNKGNLSLEKATFCENLEPLKKFKKLHVLNLQNSNFSDFSQLKGLRYLHEIYLDGSKVKSFDGLDSMKWLRIISAPKLGITSIDPLRKVPNLIELDLSENDIEDISPLESLIKLQKLNLSLNDKIRNVQPLARMRVMNDLSLAKIDIKDLSVLKDMAFLDKLNIFNTGITSLEPLRSLTKLSTLNIGFNVVHTLEPIKGMFFLQHLNVAGTAIKEMDVLGKFIYLKTLDCSNNPGLTALGVVVGLDNLEEIKCFSTKIDKNEVQHFKKKHGRCRITYY